MLRLRKELLRRGLRTTDIDFLCAMFDDSDHTQVTQRYSLLSSVATVLRWSQSSTLVRPGYNALTVKAAAEASRVLLKVMHGDEP
jgi:hypothetical protein